MASRSRSPLKKKSKSPKKHSKSPKNHDKSSPKKRTKSSPKKHTKSPTGVSKNGEKVKFYDLLAKKLFTTSDYEMVTKIVNGKNGKRKVTYYVTDNPTPRKDGSTFQNWKILSNTKA